MKKIKLILFIILLLSCITNILAKVEISEVELNPSGKDTGQEWIELYSKNEINLTDYILKNNDEQSIILNQTFKGFLIINLEKQWLDNSDEKVFLINNDKLIDETITLKDSSNDDKTWSNCDDEWIFTDSSKEDENNCETEEYEEEVIQESITKEQTQIQQEVPSPNSSSSQQPISKTIKLTNSKTYNTQTEDIKTQNNILYQSKNELIKQYSVYGFRLAGIHLIMKSHIALRAY